MKRLFLFAVTLALCACGGKSVVLDNGKLRLEFDKATASLISMTDLETGYEYLDTKAEPQRLWRVIPLKAENVITEPTKVKVRKVSPYEVKLSWSGDGAFSLVARVRMDKEKPMSYWTAEICNYDGEVVKELVYPYLANIKAFTNEKVVMPDWSGRLYSNPRHTTKSLTVGRRENYNHSMQLSAIYGEEPSGLYLATNDSNGYGREIEYIFYENLTDFRLRNFLDMGAEKERYTPPYEFILGVLHGDWYDAAQIYREWALQQDWVKNGRLHSGKMNPWLPETDVWVWNRGRSNNVLTEAEDLNDYLGDCNVSVLWHWWHNGPYDDAFPDYLPPREGRDSFVKAVARAKSKGINMTPYMNSIQWGESRRFLKGEDVDPYLARKANGSPHAHAYNVFTGNALMPMCVSQEFWHETYSNLCDTVVNRYGCPGVYMDQTCRWYWCYSKDHGHSVGGGNYWIKGYLKLVDRIREKTAPANPILVGEGTGEEWMSHMDGYLTLEICHERMYGDQPRTIVPIFNAVYHEHSICFGSLAGLTYPPYDECWPKKYCSPNTEKLMPAIFNTQFRMEQARSFVWGIQPMIANYHSFVRKARPTEMRFLAELVKKRKTYKEYLQYGRMLRAPKLADSHTEEIDVAQMSIYSYKTKGTNLFPFKKSVPMVYSSAWRNKEGDVLLAFVNISNEAKTITFSIDPIEYALSANGVLLENGVETAVWPKADSEWCTTVKIDGCSTLIYEFKNNK